MAVYVDDVRHSYRRMVMCHMWADTHEELMAMADRIGVARRWLQMPPKASWVHFDIALCKKALAIKYGAILTDRYGPSLFDRKRRLERAEALIEGFQREIDDGADPDEIVEEFKTSRREQIESLRVSAARCREMIAIIHKTRKERAERSEKKAEETVEGSESPTGQSTPDHQSQSAFDF